MPSVKAVLFDFGGTLFDYRVLENAERECLLAFADELGLTASENEMHEAYRQALGMVFTAYLPRPFYYHRDLFADAFAEMLKRLGMPFDPALYDRYRVLQQERHTRDFRLRSGVTETLSSLKEKHLHLGIVSNIDDDQLSHLLAISGIESYFDQIVSSEQTRSCKPDPEIFNHALAGAGCPAGQILFVGDTPMQDIAGANRAGMVSVLIQTRPNSGLSEASLKPDHVIHEIPELLNLV